MNIVDICEYKYPGQIELGHISFRKPDQEILIDQWLVPNEQQPTEADLLSYGLEHQLAIEVNALSIDCAARLQYLIEQTAKAKNYESALSCVSYSSSQNVQWKAEADTFIVWRDSVWAYAYNLLDEALSGIIPIPTVETVINGIPVIVWPA